MISVRAASAEDAHFLELMLVEAADWRPDATGRTVEQVLATPELAHYVLGWPQADDFGVIAEDHGSRAIGAAWCRYFSADDPGYGFVAQDVPELSIGVAAEVRRAGAGRQLMMAILDEARRRGVSKISLSVELDNFAKALYSSLGFTVIDEAGGSATMLLDLA